MVVVVVVVVVRTLLECTRVRSSAHTHAPNLKWPGASAPLPSAGVVVVVEGDGGRLVPSLNSGSVVAMCHMIRAGPHH